MSLNKGPNWIDRWRLEVELCNEKCSLERLRSSQRQVDVTLQEDFDF